MALSQKGNARTKAGVKPCTESVPIEARLPRTYALTRPEVSGIVS
jgi:hypothetical protein